jgi:hypothetical protein
MENPLLPQVEVHDVKPEVVYDETLPGQPMFTMPAHPVMPLPVDEPPMGQPVGPLVMPLVTGEPLAVVTPLVTGEHLSAVTPLPLCEHLSAVTPIPSGEPLVAPLPNPIPLPELPLEMPFKFEVHFGGRLLPEVELEEILKMYLANKMRNMNP